MSLILKGIDLPQEGELRLIISKNGMICGAEYPKVRHTYPLNLDAEALQIPKGHGNIIDDQSIEEAEIFDGSRIMKWSRDDRDNHNVLFIRSTTLLEAEE